MPRMITFWQHRKTRNVGIAAPCNSAANTQMPLRITFLSLNNKIVLSRVKLTFT